MNMDRRRGAILGLILGVVAAAGVLFIIGREAPEPPIDATDPEETSLELTDEAMPAEPDSAESGEPAALASLPSYTVLGVVEELGSPARGDVLVPAFSRETPAQVREATLRQIMDLEELGEATLFCSEDAMKAAYSDVYASEHPGALQTCGLGQIGSDGIFNSWDAAFE